MHFCSPIFAYFGPEVQFPLLSLLGAISGLVMMVGGAPYRRIRRWLRDRKDKQAAS
jgi:hypothetical protein